LQQSGSRRRARNFSSAPSDPHRRIETPGRGRLMAKRAKFLVIELGTSPERRRRNPLENPMSDSHRIQQTSITQTIARQTPKDEFGNILAKSIGQAVQVGAGLASGVLGNSVASAAINAVSRVVGVSQVGQSSPQTLAGNGGATGISSIGGSASGTNGSAAGVGPGPTGNGDSWDLLAAQQAMNQQSQSFNAAYLKLQDDMQRESREFTAISNIMKVRHDSAKSAINNIH
jgi:hypothetical protein